jgi:hypothetical protein
VLGYPFVFFSNCGYKIKRYLRVCPYVFFLFWCYSYPTFNRKVQQIGVNIMRELLLYGLEQGETRDYMEALLLSGAKTIAEIEKAQELATNAGFHSFRVASYNGEKPNFIKAVNV